MKQGIIDETLAGETGKQIKEYSENEDLQDNLKLYPDDSIFYLAMNLTQPPFDDVHVRKAMNLVMDKTGLIRAWGGPASASLQRTFSRRAWRRPHSTGTTPMRHPTSPVTQRRRWRR